MLDSEELEEEDKEGEGGSRSGGAWREVASESERGWSVGVSGCEGGEGGVWDIAGGGCM